MSDAAYIKTIPKCSRCKSPNNNLSRFCADCVVCRLYCSDCYVTKVPEPDSGTLSCDDMSVIICLRWPKIVCKDCLYKDYALDGPVYNEAVKEMTAASP